MHRPVPARPTVKWSVKLRMSAPADMPRNHLGLSTGVCGSRLLVGHETAPVCSPLGFSFSVLIGVFSAAASVEVVLDQRHNQVGVLTRLPGAEIMQRYPGTSSAPGCSKIGLATVPLPAALRTSPAPFGPPKAD